jgi:hypothetical protein
MNIMNMIESIMMNMNEIDDNMMNEYKTNRYNE